MKKNIIETHISPFQRYLEGDKRSPGTVKRYTLIVRRMLNEINKDPEKITAEDLEQYKQYLAIQKEYSKNSLYTTIKGIQAFFKYLKKDAAADLKPPKRPSQDPKYLTEAEAHALIEASKENARDYALILVLGYSGLRVGELCSLTIDDIDLSEKVIHVHSGKGDKDRIVVIEEKTIEALKCYITTRRATTNKLFVSDRHIGISPRTVEYLVKRYAQKAGLTKKVTPHVLRHTLATTLLRRGADIRFIQKILGHSSVATTQVYTHVDDEALKKTYDRAKPEY